MNCHAEGGKAPRIPFEQPFALREKLLAEGGAFKARLVAKLTAPDEGRRMPPKPLRPLTAEEREAFLEFVELLAQP
jgi:hypothetical protein